MQLLKEAKIEDRTSNLPEIVPMDPQKILDEFDPAVRPIAVTPNLSAEEAQFIQLVKETGRAADSFRQAYPSLAQTLKPSSLRTYASSLVKRFQLSGFVKITAQEIASRKKEQREKPEPRRASGKADPHIRRKINGDEMVQYAKQQFVAGTLTEEELWKRMDVLSQTAISDAARIQATNTLKGWYDITKEDQRANQLSSEDIENLLIDAMADLPHEKYMTVLLGIRAKRRELIAKRTEQINVEAEVAKYREQVRRSIDSIQGES